jgi:DMSO/TMAO reductase YedYZ molybdopterin-dependent catalytic subunit
MQKRRQFLKTSFGSLIGMGIWFNPAIGMVRRAYAKAQKIILPKNTNLEKLIQKDPALLDTSNLEPTPLKNFRTMGDTNYTANVNDWRLEVAGRVGTPLRLAYSEILTLDSIERNVLLNVRAKQALISATMIALALITGYGLSHADNPAESTAVFFVG